MILIFVPVFLVVPAGLSLLHPSIYPKQRHIWKVSLQGGREPFPSHFLLPGAGTHIVTVSDLTTETPRSWGPGTGRLGGQIRASPVDHQHFDVGNEP